MQALTVVGIILEIIVLFNFVILVHELGHYWAARWRGLKVEKFQIWFGKPIWSKTVNGVQWGLGWIPAGGFVALPQMNPMEMLEGSSKSSDEPLPKISPMDKIIVAAAGPIFSFGLAFVFAVLVWGVKYPKSTSSMTTEIGYISADAVEGADQLQVGDDVLEVDGKPVDSWRGMVDSVVWNVISSGDDTIPFKVKREGVAEPIVVHLAAPEKPGEAEDAKESGGIAGAIGGFFKRPELRMVDMMGVQPVSVPYVGDVTPNGPAAKAGIQKHDAIVEVEGKRISSPMQINDIIKASGEAPLNITVRRDGERVPITVTPSYPANRDKVHEANNRPMIGLAWDLTGDTELVRTTPMAQINDGLKTMANTLGAVFSPKSDISAKHLSGPVGIMNLYYRLFEDKDGWRRALWFSVILNINLGIMNLLPLPVLDGGHITMAIIESIRKRPLSKRLLDISYGGCALLLMGFMLFITGFDVKALFGGDDPRPGLEKTEPPRF